MKYWWNGRKWIRSVDAILVRSTSFFSYFSFFRFRSVRLDGGSCVLGTLGNSHLTVAGKRCALGVIRNGTVFVASYRYDCHTFFLLVVQNYNFVAIMGKYGAYLARRNAIQQYTGRRKKMGNVDDKSDERKEWIKIIEKIYYK